ncbi:hypothetical protein OY671_011360, partial [Metschnikowia pulcherrima]
QEKREWCSRREPGVRCAPRPMSPRYLFHGRALAAGDHLGRNRLPASEYDGGAIGPSASQDVEILREAERPQPVMVFEPDDLIVIRLMRELATLDVFDRCPGAIRPNHDVVEMIGLGAARHVDLHSGCAEAAPRRFGREGPPAAITELARGTP